MNNWNKLITLEGKEESELTLFILSNRNNISYYDENTLVAVAQLMAMQLANSLSYYGLKRLLNNMKVGNVVISELLAEGLCGLMDSAVECNQLECIENGVAKLSDEGSSYMRYVTSILTKKLSKNLRENAFFTPHCDDVECDLGYFHSTCLKCEKPLMDYDIWWRKEEILSGKELKINCHHCQADLLILADKNGIWLTNDDGFMSFKMGMIAKQNDPLF